MNKLENHWTPAHEECPVCGESKFKNLEADIWADWQPPFCPNCGARVGKSFWNWNDNSLILE